MQPVALITGASRRLGFARADALASDGWPLILDARGAEALDAARQQPLAGMPPSVVDGILDAHAQFAAEPEPVTSTVEAITGTPARTFREWGTDHAGDFC